MKLTSRSILRTTLFCLGFLVSTTVFGQVSVSSYIEKHDMGDSFHLSAVYQRCAGITLAYGAYLPLDMQDQKQLFGKMSEFFGMEAGVLLISRGEATPESIVNTVKDSMLYFKDVYYQQIEKVQRNTGSIFEGQVAQDMGVCGGLFQKLSK